MSREKETYKSYLKTINKDNKEQVFEKTGILDREYSSTTTFDDDTTFKHSFFKMIKNINNRDLFNDFEDHRDIIKLLAKFLSIQDYEINLFSSWILKILVTCIVNFSQEINECDYEIFIYWLYEEINIICENSDLTWEQFFKLMEKVFIEALTEILNGNSLMHPLKFTYKYFKNSEEIHISSTSTLIKHKCKVPSIIRDYEEIKIDVSKLKDQTKTKSDYYKNLLHIVIQATYQIFGLEMNYTLIQTAFNDQENIMFYRVPYHFRKPIIFKRPNLIENISITMDYKLNKISKKKSIKKTSMGETTEYIIPRKLFNITNSDQTHFILPLIEASESYNIINLDKNEEIEEDTSELN